MTRRRLLRWYCAASITLLVALLPTVPVSWHYYALASWVAKSQRSDWNAQVVYGYLVLVHFRLDPPEDPLDPLDFKSGWRLQVSHVNDDDLALFDAQVHGFHFAKFTYYALHSGGLTEHIVMVPLWIPALLLSIAPLLGVFRWRRARKRRAAGRCVKCGYDLRASEGVCPECGAPFGSAKRS